jgi:hypothetical protein
MITKEQALAQPREIHFGICSKTIGPRGGETIRQVRCRANGICQTWKTRPDEFRLPIKAGLYEYGEITHRNASDFHVPADCPIR